MKKLLIIFLFVNLFAACNNNGGLGLGGGSWSSAQKTDYMKQCVQTAGANLDETNAKKLCSCTMEKFQKKYPKYDDMQNGTYEEGVEVGKSCRDAMKNNNNTGQEDNNGGGNLGGGNLGGGNDGGSWTKIQHQQYVQGCATTAQRAQGFSAEQANEYCDCMTKKVEQKYSFKEANQLTAADFQTEEWQNAAAECRPRF